MSDNNSNNNNNDSEGNNNSKLSAMLQAIALQLDIVWNMQKLQFPNAADYQRLDALVAKIANDYTLTPDQVAQIYQEVGVVLTSANPNCGIAHNPITSTIIPNLDDEMEKRQEEAEQFSSWQQVLPEKDHYDQLMYCRMKFRLDRIKYEYVHFPGQASTFQEYVLGLYDSHLQALQERHNS